MVQKIETSYVFVDLGLPSGTLWANENYTDGEVQYFTYDEAIRLPVELPTMEQCQELIDECEWTWDDDRKCYLVTGKNGNSIFLPATGLQDEDSTLYDVGSYGYYWSSSLVGSAARCLYFYSDYVSSYSDDRCYLVFGFSVRPVHNLTYTYAELSAPAQEVARAEVKETEGWRNHLRTLQSIDGLTEEEITFFSTSMVEIEDYITGAELQFTATGHIN